MLKAKINYYQQLLYFNSFIIIIIISMFIVNYDYYCDYSSYTVYVHNDNALFSI